MVTRLSPTHATEAPEPVPSGWLPAASLEIAGGRSATIAFDREGRARLTLALDRPATDGDVEALAEAADLLPYLRLEDLDGAAEYPQRHARAFGLPAPLPGRWFNHAAEIELVAPPGGAKLPSRLGLYGLPTSTRSPAALAPAALAPPAPALLEQLARDLTRPLLAAARLPAAVACERAVVLAALAFAVLFTWRAWITHARFGTFGYDLGIYAQGTWLLAHLNDPFVTVRGLPLFGEHASYILLLVAPLYRLWEDPRLLLALQAVALACPAWPIYRLSLRYLNRPGAACAVAVAYLAFPGLQQAAIWQFHPEVLAVAFLAFAALAAETGRERWTAVLVALALLCKEDVGLVVAALGGMLWWRGRALLGQRLLFAGVAWFLATTFILIPLANGRPGSLFEQTYGVRGAGLLAVGAALPEILWRALVTAFSDAGVAYLLLTFLPLLGLPLLGVRWLAPALPVLLLNLASMRSEQHTLRYHYLAVATPFLVLAAAWGLAELGRRRRHLLTPAAGALAVTALVMSWYAGGTPWSRGAAPPPPSPADATRRAAIALVEPGAPTSAQFHLVPHLAHRTRIYEFPNPFRAANWGFGSDSHDPTAATSIRFVLVEPALLTEEDQRTLQGIRAEPGWRVLLDRDGVLVLERQGSG